MNIPNAPRLTKECARESIPCCAYGQINEDRPATGIIVTIIIVIGNFSPPKKENILGNFASLKRLNIKAAIKPDKTPPKTLISKSGFIRVTPSVKTDIAKKQIGRAHV